MIQNPLISICLITYNQERYIKQTLESILMQVFPFDMEVVVSNDGSTDATHEIIKSVIESHAKGHLIRYFNQDQNLGMMPNFIFALQQCTGTYIAICEGDDYWTDPLKLDKQVSFLEAHCDYGICFHNVKQLNLLHSTAQTIIPGVLTDTDFTLSDYILANKTATCSIVYRRALFDPIPDWFTTVPFGDLGLILHVLFNSDNQAGKVLADTMAVYRIHDTGVHGSLHKTNKSLILAYKQHLRFTNILKKQLLFGSEYELAHHKKKLNTYAVLSRLAKGDANLLLFGKYKVLWYITLTRLKLSF